MFDARNQNEACVMKLYQPALIPIDFTLVGRDVQMDKIELVCEGTVGVCFQKFQVV